MIALSNTSLDSLVKPEMKNKWQKTKKEWFADPGSVEQSKTPGYLKEEFASDNGSFVGLSAKVINKALTKFENSFAIKLIFFNLVLFRIEYGYQTDQTFAKGDSKTSWNAVSKLSKLPSGKSNTKSNIFKYNTK